MKYTDDYIWAAKIVADLGKLGFAKVERKIAKEAFITTAKQIKDSHDANQVKIGDAVCINGNSGVVIGKESSGITMIPAFWKQGKKCWYERHLNLVPNLRRTDSSYMNSVSHDIQTNANSYSDGRANTEAIAKLLNQKDEYTRTYFPAFEHCIELGKECFLPSINQLMELFKEDIIRQINYTLKTFHADKLIPIEDEMLIWSSTDDVERLYEDYGFSDSGAYALSISTSGEIEKKVISKKENILVLPFFNYSFS